MSAHVSLPSVYWPSLSAVNISTCAAISSAARPFVFGLNKAAMGPERGRTMNVREVEGKAAVLGRRV